MAKEKTSVFDRNFAEDKQLAERTAAYYGARLAVIRASREQLHQAWWRFFNMWNVTKDGYHTYEGRAQLYIPEVRKNVEAQARQLTKSAFPGEDTFDVSPGQTGTRKGSQAWKATHTWAMQNCNLKTKYFVAMRQECLLGTSPIYLPWRKTVRREFRSRRQGKKIIPLRQEVELFNGPDFIVRDLFRWFTFNPKKDDLSDGCFEDMAATHFDLLDLKKNGLIANYDEIVAGGGNAYLGDGAFKYDVLRAMAEGIQIEPNVAYAGQAEIRKDEDERPGGKTYVRTLIHQDMVFPEACEEGEDPDQPIPMQVEIFGNTTCGMIRRNPFYHQSPPYVVGRYIQPNADEFYGQGIPWATQYMQYELNSKAEQGMDSATLALNPIAIIDPGMAGEANDFNIEPGAKWLANPAGVHLASLPDTSPIAYQAISMLRTHMQDYSDRSPALPPQLMGKSRTATQSEMVFDALGVDNWLFQLQNEGLILTPMLQQWEALTDQNMDDEMTILVLGRKAGDMMRTQVTRSDLLGRYAYVWKGASSTANKQVQGRQMLDALKVLSMMPPEALSKLNFQYAEYFKILWKDIWDLKDSDKILGSREELSTQDAEFENKMAGLGLEIEVLPNDDDASHLPVHDKGLHEAKSDMERQVIMIHMLEHKKQIEDKKMRAMQAQQQQQMQMQMLMLQAQAGHKGGSRGRSQGSGNRAQLSPAMNSGNMGSGMRA